MVTRFIVLSQPRFSTTRTRTAYSVESATIQYYKDEDGLFAVTFRANAGTVALQTLPDTASMRKKPFAEVTLHIPKLPALAFRVGSTFTVPKGFDDSTREQ